MKIIFILTMTVCLCFLAATDTKADTEADFERVREDVFFALIDPIPAGAVSQLQDRRRLLRQLFGEVPPEFAPEFLNELGDSNNGGEFSELFHHELATATRREMLDILRDHITSLNESPATGRDTNTPPPRNTIVEVPFMGFGPLPPERAADYEALVPQLTALANQFGGERGRRLQCMTRFLATPGIDDRVIKWRTICPDFEVTNIPFFQGCPPFSLKTDSNTMFDRIRSQSDIDQKGAGLKFVTHLRADFVSLSEFGSIFDVTLEMLDQELINSTKFLDQMTSGALGGGSMAPEYIVQIKNWVADHQRSNTSVLACYGG